jgi:hypothetical protein
VPLAGPLHRRGLDGVSTIVLQTAPDENSLNASKSGGLSTNDATRRKPSLVGRPLAGTIQPRPSVTAEGSTPKSTISESLASIRRIARRMLARKSSASSTPWSEGVMTTMAFGDAAATFTRGRSTPAAVPRSIG